MPDSRDQRGHRGLAKKRSTLRQHVEIDYTKLAECAKVKAFSGEQQEEIDRLAGLLIAGGRFILTKESPARRKRDATSLKKLAQDCDRLMSDMADVINRVVMLKFPLFQFHQRLRSPEYLETGPEGIMKLNLGREINELKNAGSSLMIIKRRAEETRLVLKRKAERRGPNGYPMFKAILEELPLSLSHVPSSQDS